VDNSASPDHLLSEQIDQQQRRVAFRAVATQANGAGKEMALWAAALADEALAAAGTLVDSPRYHRAPTLELLSEALQVWWAGLMTQAEGLLLVGSRAIARAP